MHSLRVLLLVLPLSLSFACQSAPVAAGAPPEAKAMQAEGAKAPEGKDDAKAKAEAKKQKQKELRGKQRELAAAKVEQEIAAMDRTVRQLGVEAALAKTADDLTRARQDLESFTRDVRPRELAEKKLGLDQSTYRAEHSKDELGELTSMYEADEFARQTKELVLKRGRRDLEVAERNLALVRQESAFFEAVTMAQREQDLRRKVADAELERRKAEIDAEKSRREGELAMAKAQDRMSDLQEEIDELTAALAKETP